jgi:hypothetical protein
MDPPVLFDTKMYASEAIWEGWRINKLIFKGLGLGVAETVESDRLRCQLLTSEQGSAGLGLRERRLSWLFLKVGTDYKRRYKSLVVSCRNFAT